MSFEKWRMREWVPDDFLRMYVTFADMEAAWNAATAAERERWMKAIRHVEERAIAGGVTGGTIAMWMLRKAYARLVDVRPDGLPQETDDDA